MKFIVPILGIIFSTDRIFSEDFKPPSIIVEDVEAPTISGLENGWD